MSGLASWDMSLDGWMIAVAAMAAMACALPGCFLVLRKVSLMGDALSHAVLPGIAAGYVITQSRSNWVMFLGAIVAGLLTAYLTQWLRRAARVDAGAAMGIVFTTLFAIGLILLVRGANDAHLHPDCVIVGALELTPLDLQSVAGIRVPRAFIILTVVFLVNAGLTIALFKELRITAFDPELAQSLGYRPNLLHYVLMTMTAITSVAAFESVGSIIVVAMIIVPAATAKLLAQRLSTMVILALVIAVASAVLGHLSAITLPSLAGYNSTTTSSMIAVVAGVGFMVVTVIGSHDALLWRTLRRFRFVIRTLEEDLLALAWRLEERGDAFTPTHLAGELRSATGTRVFMSRLTLANLSRRGLLDQTANTLALSDEGRTRAVALVRSHRLWEAWLERSLGIAPDHVHDTAMRLEHITDQAMQKRLAREAGEPTADPHGKRIPTDNDESNRST